MENEHTHHNTDHHKKDDKQKLSIPAAIIVAGLIIAGAIFATKSPGTPSENKQQAQKVDVNIKDVAIQGEPFIGNPDATPIAYFSDYQCPFCKKFEQAEMQQIVAKYVETGKVKLVFKDFVFLGPDSTDAAIYGRAVWKMYPAQYFAWREAMYEAQDEEGGEGFGDRASIEALTRQIPGIDQEKVSKDLDANMRKYEALVKANYDEALKLGVTGTPSVIIGKGVVSGAHEFGEYEKAIEKAI